MSTVSVAVIGNPNAGKTTLFNDLTGARQHTGNWPGVTVERKEGEFKHCDKTFRLIDLPGTYSLDSDAPSLDERIAREFILSHKADILINIIDASNLERSLYLTAQLLEMGVPMLVVLNMMDVADKLGYILDPASLETSLGCPVITSVATRKNGISELKDKLCEFLEHLHLPTAHPRYEQDVEAAITELSSALAHKAPKTSLRWISLQLLLQHELPHLSPTQTSLEIATRHRNHIETEQDEDLDLIIADGRYEFARTLAAESVRKKDALTEKSSDRIDDIVLNRWLGVPIFLFAMYLMFTFTINIGGAFIDFFDMSAGAIFIDGVGSVLEAMHTPDWLRVIIADGIGGGIQVVATFVPIIAFLYLFLSLLEDSGYMARAAFVMDRLMRALGLPGKAFVPLVVGFGCNVPAIMATRTLDVERERLITIMMSPFMSCGARLSVYALFAAAFFPTGGQNIVFLLYIIGIIAAMFTAYLLKSTILRGEPEDFLMELPTYQVPNLQGVLLHTWSKLKGFVTDAGKYIIVMVMVINVLNSWGTDGSFGNENSENSVLSSIGKSLTPALSPLGIEEDNWAATVGIFAGVLAKEVVVGTLDAIYSQLDRDDQYSTSNESNEAEAPTLGSQIIEAVKTIPANLGDSLSSLDDPLGFGAIDTSGDPALAAAAQDVDTATFGAMVKRFDGQIGAFAYLLFILLYFPCVAATSAIKREAGWPWTIAAVSWTTGLAYVTSSFFYQAATYSRHPGSSLMWIAVAIAFYIGVFAVLKLVGSKYSFTHSQTIDISKDSPKKTCCH
ncbi:MAG: Fe(2+) transporter permease subunit FeoB [bacterium]